MDTQQDQSRECPFCGSADVSEGEVLSELPDGGATTQSMCRGCGALGPDAHLRDGEVDFGSVKATAAWNRRAAPRDVAPVDATELDKWAPARIWLQRGVGEGGSHTWCEDNEVSDDLEEAEYVRADVAPVAVGVPQSVIDALRFYANGHHYTIDDDHQEFDTVSGEPQNWLCSMHDDDCTMIEDGSIAKAALCGGISGFEEPEDPIEGEVLTVAPTPAAPAQPEEPLRPLVQATIDAWDTYWTGARTNADGRDFIVRLNAVRHVIKGALSSAPGQPMTQAARDAQAEIDRLNAIINTPQADDFLRAVSIEAEHQRQRWSSDHDAGKTPADWYWLVGHLAGKALHAHAAGDLQKAEHHEITTAAAIANWHGAMFSKTNMRPGIIGETDRAAHQASVVPSTGGGND